MNNQTTITDIFGPVISSYSRKQAIEDGYLHPVSELFPSDCRIYKYPVCFSNEVVNLIEGDNMGAWVWDICFMSAKCPTKQLDPTRQLFKVTLPRKKGTTATKTFELMAICGPDDNAAPCITICFPNED